MPHAVTGKAGAVSLSAVDQNGKLTEWNLEVRSENVVDRGSGEVAQSRVHLYTDWRATFRALLPDLVDMGIVTVATVPKSAVDLVGTEAAIALKIRTADTNPYFSGTGLVTNIRHTNNIEQPHEFEVTVECSTGSLPTMDATPA